MSVFKLPTLTVFFDLGIYPGIKVGGHCKSGAGYTGNIIPTVQVIVNVLLAHLISLINIYLWEIILLTGITSGYVESQVADKMRELSIQVNHKILT